METNNMESITQAAPSLMSEFLQGGENDRHVPESQLLVRWEAKVRYELDRASHLRKPNNFD